MRGTVQQAALGKGVCVVCQLGTARTDCVASRVGENNDADGQTSSLRSGQRGGQQDRGGRVDVTGNRGRVGALWNRAGGRMSLRGRPGQGGAAGVTLPLGCLAISCAPVNGLDDR